VNRPVIGITAGRGNQVTERHERQAVTIGCRAEYADPIVRAGGAPILMPPVEDLKAVAAMMRPVDGLLLSGGGDIVSHVYGEEPHPENLNEDPIRDEMELEAVRLAMEMGVPIFGICRGIQTLNVALGGTLVQDIPAQVPGAFEHHNIHERGRAPVHTIDIEEESLLAKVLGTTCTTVNSRHHQAVKDTGRGLRVNCRSPDGIIEGIEADDGRPILAVQCHPEDSLEEYPLFQKLFDWLVAEAGKRH